MELDAKYTASRFRDEQPSFQKSPERNRTYFSFLVRRKSRHSDRKHKMNSEGIFCRRRKQLLCLQSRKLTKELAKITFGVQRQFQPFHCQGDKMKIFKRGWFGFSSWFHLFKRKTHFKCETKGKWKTIVQSLVDSRGHDAFDTEGKTFHCSSTIKCPFVQNYWARRSIMWWSFWLQYHAWQQRLAHCRCWCCGNMYISGKWQR